MVQSPENLERMWSFSLLLLLLFFFSLFFPPIPLSPPDLLPHAQVGCDTPIPGVPLTTRQPSKYPWMSSNPTLNHRVPFFGTHDLTKIWQSLLSMGSSTENTTCTIYMSTWSNIIQRPHQVHIRVKIATYGPFIHTQTYKHMTIKP